MPLVVRRLVPLSGSMVLALLVAACDQPKTEAPLPRPVRVSTVVAEPSVPDVRYAAVIRPRIEADLGFRVPGKIVRRLVEVGQRVTAGQPLARLDPADLDLQVKATEAQLASAKADQVTAESEYRRAGALKRGGWASAQAFDRAQNQSERAKAQVAQLQASLSVLRNNSQYAELTADADGVVTAVLAEPGQVMAAGQPAVRLARLGEMEAVADVPENQATGLAGQALTVEAWSLPGVTLGATLREVSPAADTNTRTYRVRASIAHPPAELQLGMTATLVARAPASVPVARVPLTALTQQGDQPAVWIINAKEDGVVLRPVKVVAYTGDWAIIGAGLAGGERVVTAGAHKLDAGQRVRVWREPS